MVRRPPEERIDYAGAAGEIKAIREEKGLGSWLSESKLSATTLGACR